MDLFTIASAFATIVGLLSKYKSEERNIEEDEYTDFINWLNEKQHEELVSKIESSMELSSSIKEFLHQHNDVILSQFNKLEEMLMTIASQLDGFSKIAEAIQPRQGISDQAMSIVRQLVESGASHFMEHKVGTSGTNDYIIIGGKAGFIKYDESQFIEDDLDSLVTLGLLKLDRSGRDRKFFITRMGSQLVS